MRKLYDDIILDHDGGIAEPPWGQSRIHQLVPAQPGWWVVARDIGGTSFCAPVACWALVQLTDGARIVYPMGDTEGGDIDLIGDDSNHVVIYDPTDQAIEEYVSESVETGLRATLARWREIDKENRQAKS